MSASSEDLSFETNTSGDRVKNNEASNSFEISDESIVAGTISVTWKQARDLIETCNDLLKDTIKPLVLRNQKTSIIKDWTVDNVDEKTSKYRADLKFIRDSEQVFVAAFDWIKTKQNERAKQLRQELMGQQQGLRKKLGVYRRANCPDAILSLLRAFEIVTDKSECAAGNVTSGFKCECGTTDLELAYRTSPILIGMPATGEEVPSTDLAKFMTLMDSSVVCAASIAFEKSSSERVTSERTVDVAEFFADEDIVRDGFQTSTKHMPRIRL